MAVTTALDLPIKMICWAAESNGLRALLASALQVRTGDQVPGALVAA
jgi:hypothetical protein